MKRRGMTKKKTAQRITGPRLLPLKQAANCMGLTVWALRERIWAGHIPVLEFPGGRKQYIDTHDIEDFIQQNKKTKS